MQLMTVENILDVVEYGKTVVIAKEGAGVLAVVTMEKNIKHMRKWSYVEPYLERPVVVLSATPSSGIYLEIM